MQRLWEVWKEHGIEHEIVWGKYGRSMGKYWEISGGRRSPFVFGWQQTHASQTRVRPSPGNLQIEWKFVHSQYTTLCIGNPYKNNTKVKVFEYSSHRCIRIGVLKSWKCISEWNKIPSNMFWSAYTMERLCGSGGNQGISVNELLLKLKITKQSLNRVLRDLKKSKIIKQIRDQNDSRKKLLYLDKVC